MTKLAIAQYLISSLQLAPGDNFTLPTQEYFWDRALYRMCKDKKLPSWLSEELTFTSGTFGVQCREIDTILQYARDGLLISVIAPDCRRYSVSISDDTARVFVERLELPAEGATEFGRSLREYLRKAEEEWVR